MQEAWEDMLQELINQYGEDEFNNDSLALIQNVYYQGALAGTVILHNGLTTRSEDKNYTAKDLLAGVNAFGAGLLKSVRSLHAAWADAPYQVKTPKREFKH